jgi:hypothetical protein
MSNLRGRVLRLEREARIRRRFAAIQAEIARKLKAQQKRVTKWRRSQEEQKQKEQKKDVDCL